MATYTIINKVKRSDLSNALGKTNGMEVIFINKTGGEEKFTLRITKMTPKLGDPKGCRAEAEVEKAELKGSVNVPFTRWKIPFLTSWILNPRCPKKISLEISEIGDNYIHM